MKRETNVNNPWQGEFRKAPLSIDLLNYAIESDTCYHNVQTNKFLVLSHLDQFTDDIPIIGGYRKYPTLIKKDTIVLELKKANPEITIISSSSEEM